MSFPLPGVLVDPGGTSQSVSITDAHGNTPTVYADPNGQNTLSMPHTITARTTFYLPGEGPWTVTPPGTTLTLEDGQVATLAVSGQFVPLAVPASAAQGFISNPTDQSALIQAVIDAAFNAGGGEVRLPPGVFYGAFKMRPSVNLVGSGWQSALRAMPGQTNPVVDYSTYNAFHTRLRDLRVDGNYIYGRTDGVTQGACTGINMDTTPSSRVAWMFSNPAVMTPVMSDGNPYHAQAGWNDAYNEVDHVLVTAIGGTYGIYCGINQNGTYIHDSFIYLCATVGLAANCTDSHFTNVSVGACGTGILILQSNNKFANCKSWYHGVITGYVQNGDGYRINLPDNTTFGAVQLVNCESQDNINYGLNILQGNGVLVRGLVTGGDSAGAVRLNQALNCDIDFSVQYADRTQTTIGVVLDATTSAPVGNRIRWTIDTNLPGIATFTPYSGAGGYNGFGNDIQGPEQQGIALLGLSNTITPTSAKNHMGGAFTGAINVAAPSYTVPLSRQPGTDLTISLTDTAGGHTVTWDPTYHGVSGFTTIAGKYSIFRFMFVGAGVYMLIGSSVNV